MQVFRCKASWPDATLHAGKLLIANNNARAGLQASPGTCYVSSAEGACLHNHHAANCDSCMGCSRSRQIALRLDLCPFTCLEVHNVDIIGCSSETDA